MPFGLCNAPATFERLMECVLHGLSWKQCLVFLDDSIVFSKTFSEQLDILREVFNRLKTTNLKLSPGKCILLQDKVNYLGHVVSADGVGTDPKKIESIVEWPIPRTVRDVRSFLGLCSYYRRFVKNFATIAKPLHSLTEKGVPFDWSGECENAFKQLKRVLTEAPILNYPIEDGDFVIDTDASNVGVGGVLSQIQNGQETVISYFSRCLSKCERSYCVTRKELLAVVATVKQFHHYLYGRKFLVRSDHGALQWIMNFKKPEGQVARWIEMLSTYDFQVVFRPGRVHSNADPLSRRPCYSHNCAYCEKAENRYGEDLLEVAHPISHQVGVLESYEGGEHDSDGVDQLPTRVNVELVSSRHSDLKVGGGAEKIVDWPPAMETASSMYGINEQATAADMQTHPSNQVIFVQTRSGASDALSLDIIRQAKEADPVLSVVKKWFESNERPNWSVISPECPDVKRYWYKWENLVIQDNVLCYKWFLDTDTYKALIVVPEELKATVLTQLHNVPTAAHLGVKKTYEKVKQRFYWLNLRKYEEQWCQCCEVYYIQCIIECFIQCTC